MGRRAIQVRPPRQNGTNIDGGGIHRNMSAQRSESGQGLPRQVAHGHLAHVAGPRHVERIGRQFLCVEPDLSDVDQVGVSVEFARDLGQLQCAQGDTVPRLQSRWPSLGLERLLTRGASKSGCGTGWGPTPPKGSKRRPTTHLGCGFCVPTRAAFALRRTILIRLLRRHSPPNSTPLLHGQFLRFLGLHPEPPW